MTDAKRASSFVSGPAYGHLDRLASAPYGPGARSSGSRRQGCQALALARPRLRALLADRAQARQRRALVRLGPPAHVASIASPRSPASPSIVADRPHGLGPRPRQASDPRQSHLALGVS